MAKKIFFPLILSLLIGCTNDKSEDTEKALTSITVKDLTSHVEVLASDKYEGRKPFSPGEKLTINYLSEQMKRIGLQPAFGDSYFQEVKMVEIASKMEKPAQISFGADQLYLSFPDQIAVSSSKTMENIEVVKSELVFVGFGIVAPEYEWNDYEGMDVKGKTVVVLVNDPGLYTKNDSLFKGVTMTYYGRWTYKFEEAERQGAEGVIIVHESLGAGYPYDIPRKSALSSNFYLSNASDVENSLLFSGWVSKEGGQSIFDHLNISVDSLRMAACKSSFESFDIKTKISLNIHNVFEYNSSQNVAGIIKGSKKPKECIIYSAHWDHFGIGEPENGDSIYNGAVDNGTSLAWMLEIAEAFKALPDAPERSILFLAPTAEEQGLLGSKWYANDPVFENRNTLAAINNDLLLPIGRMKDVMVTGYGQSDLDNLVEKMAKQQDRYIFPDPNPHTGMYFRSDHFSFAQKGIPSLFIRGNCDSREFGKEWASAQEQDYIKNRYHRPADNYHAESWDFNGIVEDAQLAFEIGYFLTKTNKFPEWNDNSEFKNIRDN